MLDIEVQSDVSTDEKEVNNEIVAESEIDQDLDELESDSSNEDLTEGNEDQQIGGYLEDDGVQARSTTDNDSCYDSTKIPKVKTYISFKKVNEEWHTAKVLSIQPKRKGSYKNWINIHIDGEDKPCSFNWEHVEKWKELPSPDSIFLLTDANEFNQDIVDAKEKELSNLLNNDVYEVVNYSGQETVSTRWVFTEKVVDEEIIVKARMVARGFEENLNEIRTDSPTCNKHSLRFVMVSASMFNWTVYSIDIASAFLQGKVIEREVYLRPPKDVCDPSKVWKLKRHIYGLNDAPRSWYDKVSHEFLTLGAVRSLLDPAMFMWYKDAQLIGHLVSHVDDFVYGGTVEWNAKVIDSIKSQFKISKESQGSFIYIGLSVVQTNEMITIDQSKYIENISNIDISSERAKQINEILISDEKAKLKSLSGQMLWVTNQTRPDMAFETCLMSNMGKQPTVRKIVDANKAVKKMKNSNDVKIKIHALGSPDEVAIVAFGDGTHASLPDGSSQGGYVVFLYGNDKYIPIIWQSKKLKRVTKSPLASETLALGETADAALLMAKMFQEIYKLELPPPVKCYCDCKSLTDALHTTNTVEDMSLRVNIARLREMVNLGEISVEWKEGKLQLADALTKRGASCQALLQVLNLGVLEH